MIVQELVTKLSFASAPGVASAQKAFHSVYQAAAKSARQQQAAQERAAAMAQRATERAAAAQQKAHERAARAAERAAAQAAKAAERASAKIIREQEKMARAAEKAASKRAAATNRFMGGGMAIMGGAALAGVGIGLAGAASVIDTAKSYESLKASLVTATGSAEEASSAFVKLQRFAAQTPFTLDQSIKGFVRLKNLGLDPSEAALRSYGNTAGAMNKSLMDMIEAVADASVGEFERLKEFGIKAAKEGDKVVFSFRGTKTAVKNDAKSIEKYLMDLGNTKFAGGMAQQSKTIGGQISNLQDNFDQLKFAMWQSGMGEAVMKLTKGLSEMVVNAKPLAIQTGLFIKNNLPGVLSAVAFGFKALKALMPFIITGMTLFVARWTQLKAMALMEFLAGLALKIKGVGVAAWFANTAIGFIPALIIAAVAAIALFALDTYNYFTTGKSVLLDYTAQWPWLHKAIKWVMENAITWFLALYEGIKTGIEFWMPKLTTAFEFWSEVIKVAFAMIEPKFKWLLDIIGQITNAAGNAWTALTQMFNANSDDGAGGMGTSVGSDGTKFTVGNKTFTKNQDIANKLTQVGAGMYSGAKMCLKGVWMTQQAVLRGTSAIKASHAYLAADELARDKRFQEIQVTPDMYKRAMAGDKQMQALLHGATVIYNRQSGFSPTAGHAETWDTYKRKAYYGTGAASMVRSDQMINNARVFVPISGSQVGGGGGANVTNNVNVNVGGSNASASQIGSAAAKGASDGTTKGFQRVKTTTRQQVTPG